MKRKFTLIEMIVVIVILASQELIRIFFIFKFSKKENLPFGNRKATKSPVFF